ncbi:hypothetical protein MSAN_01586800 [Mycena sanguinolenta]|uniref:F-box domain-containing protein n=1 Tax=Mycena sanguinolenta TaxID=230812 RepID=A0A8H6Y446_9AGAR|nr:hypothetical protein MSAN_01586800 [Mycena sanguinolenta]
MILDLSVELLEAIGTQLAQSDHASLRQVCKNLNGAIYPLFFSVLTLKTSENGLSKDGVEQLKALATGGTGWSLYAKTLRITSAKTANGAHDNSETPVDLLAAALATLSNIQSVVWHAHDSGWAQTAIFAFVNIWAHNLRELELSIPWAWTRTLNVFELKVQSLQSLTLRIPGWSPTRLEFEDLCDLIYSGDDLDSSHLEATTKFGVWCTLLSRADHTRFSEITTNVVTEELFDCLSSYSGLEKLKLEFPDGGSEDESNRLADIFFNTVLPRHAESLLELSCPAAYESRFSFGTHNVNVVSLLHKLTKLEMSINAGAVRTVDPPKSFIDADGKEYPVISIGIPVEAEQADIDPVVTLLLETAAMFPTLHSLTILSAETERNRGAWCGNGRIHHTGAVDAAIGNAVKAFRTDVPCSTIVHAGVPYPRTAAAVR